MAAEQDREPGGKPRALTAETQTREILLDLLVSELEVAGTLISVAETSTNYETVVRNVSNAWLALTTAAEFANQLDLDSAAYGAFRDSYVGLCQRLGDLQVRPED